MKTVSMKFDGSLLQRGFWLYVWRVSQGRKRAYYVGRTGDSSSKFAASPFSRVSRHLDTHRNGFQPAAKEHDDPCRLQPVRLYQDVAGRGFARDEPECRIQVGARAVGCQVDAHPVP